MKISLCFLGRGKREGNQFWVKLWVKIRKHVVREIDLKKVSFIFSLYTAHKNRQNQWYCHLKAVTTTAKYENTFLSAPRRLVYIILFFFQIMNIVHVWLQQSLGWIRDDQITSSSFELNKFELKIMICTVAKHTHIEKMLLK